MALTAMLFAVLTMQGCADEDDTDDKDDPFPTFCEVPLASLPAGAPAWCAKYGDADCDGVLRIDCGGTDNFDAPRNEHDPRHPDDCQCGDPWCKPHCEVVPDEPPGAAP